MLLIGGLRTLGEEGKNCHVFYIGASGEKFGSFNVFSEGVRPAMYLTY